jgi:hypothetical protein
MGRKLGPHRLIMDLSLLVYREIGAIRSEMEEVERGTLANFGWVFWARFVILNGDSGK